MSFKKKALIPEMKARGFQPVGIEKGHPVFEGLIGPKVDGLIVQYDTPEAEAALSVGRC